LAAKAARGGTPRQGHELLHFLLYTWRTPSNPLVNRADVYDFNGSNFFRVNKGYLNR
jgi:hypothetical protein